jgi:hypothetical protein
VPRVSLAAAITCVMGVLLVVVAGVVLLRQGHPEDTATHADEREPDSTSERIYGYSERPAGADAEDMGSPDTDPPRENLA